MTTSEQQNVNRVQEAYAAFGRGDLPGLLAMLTEDVEWQHPRPREIPWGGHRRGREQVAQFFVALGGTVTVEAFEPRKFVAQEDTVAVLGQERMRVQATGRVYDVDWVHIFTLREGKIAGFQEYTDTASIVEALKL